ncbi:MAG: cation:proton antiporter [Bacteroidota bacterium]|nr:cation:proton antiporter [Bacteroidota bacterium]
MEISPQALPYILLIAFSALVILSYFYNVIANKYKIPSVISLLITGQALRMVLAHYNIPFHIPDNILHILGATGLILIVLEAALDLRISAEKKVLIRKSLLAALIILLFSCFAITYFTQWYFDTSLKQAFVYSIPLSVISSAIVIPSVVRLAENTKEFMIYESTFSDIIGILLFNFITLNEIRNVTSVFQFGLEVILTAVFSVVFAIILAFLLKKINTRVKFFLIISILIMVYALGKIFHLSGLLLVLAFGMVLNNMDMLLKTPLKRHIDTFTTRKVLSSFKPFIDESSFLIRTFFFLVFGFSMDV